MYTADVRLNLADKRYELNVSLHQLGVLLLFNGGTTLSLKEIQDDTKLSDVEIGRVCKVGRVDSVLQQGT